MWAFRRASLPLRNKSGLRIGTSKTHFSDTELPYSYIQCQAGTFEFSHLIHEEKCMSSKRLYCTQPVCGNAFLVKRGFSSKGTESEVLDSTKSRAEDEDDELVSEPDLSDEDDIDENVETEHSQWKSPASALFETIKDSEDFNVRKAVDKWVSEGNELTHKEVALTVSCFRRFRMAKKALEFLECLEENDGYEYEEITYSSRVGLIAKVNGLKKAEDYIETIPDSYRGEIVYQSLLASCVLSNKMMKAEKVFQKIRDLGLPLTVNLCNQMIILYKRLNKRKLANILELMEKENIKPSLVTFKLLISIKGQLRDTKGVEEILEDMKSQGIEPDTQLRFIVGRHYAQCGDKEKAESILKEMEGNGLEENRKACRSLITLYGKLGKAEEVERVWKVCESDPKFVECTAAIGAWGELGRVEEAEAVFNRMSIIWKNSSYRQCVELLKVYAKNDELEKAQDLSKWMSESGVKIGPLALNALVKLHLGAGEIEKADSILMEALQQNRMKPIPSTYTAVMRVYSEMGDIQNTERIFYWMKEAGHMIKWHQFEDLVKAYVNARKPAYGMRDRMKAEDIFANRVMNESLNRIDPFRKTAVSYLLD